MSVSFLMVSRKETPERMTERIEGRREVMGALQ